MRYIVIITAVTAMFVASSASPVGAQQMRVGVYSDPIVECDFGLPAQFGVGVAHIVVKRSVDFHAMRFRAQVPACNGIIWISESSPGIYLGNSQDGITLALPGCQTNVFSGIEVLAITFLMTGTGTEMCEWSLEPYPGDPYMVVVDCDDVWAEAASNGSGQINMGSQSPCGLTGENNVIAGYRPDPFDGATGISVNPQLDWMGPANYMLFADHPLDVAIPGHNHYNEDLVTLSGNPYSPPTLDPNTTYYWQLIHEECCTLEPHAASSGQYSFTTADAISTETSTWGLIKSLYQ